MNELQPINLAAINMGCAVDQVNEALAMIAKDVVERGDIAKPRSVILTIQITPDGKVVPGQANLPDIDWKVDWKVPGATGMTTRGYVENGELKVSTESMDASQPALPFKAETGEVIAMKGKEKK